MIREIVQIGNPILRKVMPEITNDAVLQKLEQDLADTLAKQARGVAIASPQIFEEYRAYLINIKTRNEKDKGLGPLLMVNPVIESEFGKEVEMFEGCLSISHADLFGMVKRKEKVKVTYYDVKGNMFTEEFGGFKARVIQHEYDHLNGVLFTDKVDVNTLMSGDEYIKWQKSKS